MECGRWKGIVGKLYRERTTPYTWKGSYRLILMFYSAKINLMGFVVMSPCGYLQWFRWSACFDHEMRKGSREKTQESCFYRLVLKQVD